MAECPLCDAPPANIVWEDEHCFVVRVEDLHYPAFHRVIWRDHVRELTDLPHSAQRHLLAVLAATEAALRRLVDPHKINLASFGNMVPHLHWHVIPRHPADRHFPEPIWGTAQREGERLASPAREAMREAIDEALAAGGYAV